MTESNKTQLINHFNFSGIFFLVTCDIKIIFYFMKAFFIFAENYHNFLTEMNMESYDVDNYNIAARC